MTRGAQLIFRNGLLYINSFFVRKALNWLVHVSRNYVIEQFLVKAEDVLESVVKVELNFRTRHGGKGKKTATMGQQ